MKLATVWEVYIFLFSCLLALNKTSHVIIDHAGSQLKLSLLLWIVSCIACMFFWVNNAYSTEMEINLLIFFSIFVETVTHIYSLLFLSQIGWLEVPVPQYSCTCCIGCIANTESSKLFLCCYNWLCQPIKHYLRYSLFWVHFIAGWVNILVSK